MALPFILAFAGLIYLKPQEFVASLRTLPLLHIVFALAIVGAIVDTVRGAVTGALPSQAPYVVAFALWALFAILVRDRASVPHVMSTVGIGVGIYFAVAIGMSSANRVWVFATFLLSMALFLSAVAYHQSRQPFVCFFLDPGEESTDAPEYDGHACETSRQCEQDAGDDGREWLCERAGLFGTTSIGNGRVRYRGSLSDPNELALVVGSTLPFAFALAEKKKNLGRIALLFASLFLFGACVIDTESRGGQLVFAAVMALYCLRRFRLWGAAVGALAALPVLLYGGRAGAEADASAKERVEAWYEGISMLKEHPFSGVGPGMFVDHHTLTAHNAYVLVAAETGLVGLLLWSLCIYATVKIPWQLWWQRDPRLAPALKPLAPALLFALIGMLVGIFFLSFAYHHVLYLFMGLSGALGLAAKKTLPDFRVRISPREIIAIAVCDVAFVLLMFVYTRLEVGA